MPRCFVYCLIPAILLAACAPDDSSGVRGVHDDEIIIGTHLDLSGPIVAWGSGIRNGMVMAIEEINAKGGIHGRTLRLVVEDNGYDPQKAVLAARKLASRDKVFAVIGAIGSPSNAAALPILLEKNIPNLFPIAAVPVVYYPHHPLKFVNETPMGSAVRAGVRYFVERRGKRKFGILYQDDDFGTEIKRGTETELAALGLTPVAITSYKRGSTDFSAQIARLRQAGADMVILGTIVRETAGAAKAAAALNWRVPMLCTMGCYAEETADLAPAQGDNIYAVAQVEIPYPDSGDIGLAAWRARYEARFGERPNVAAVRGTMAIRLFADALRAAGRDFTQQDFIRALEDLPAWRDPELGGAPIDYMEDNHIGIDEVFLAQLVRGRWHVIEGYMKVPHGE